MKICGQYRAKFGEGPIWHEHFGVIWLDVAAKKIITYDPDSNKDTVYDALGWIKSLIPTNDGQFIGVYKEGLYYINFKLGIKKPFILPPELTEMHYLNKAKCGPDGQIWVGCSDGFFKKFKESPQTAFSNYPFSNAKLFSINTTGELTTHLSTVASSNGLDWDRNSNKFYHIDSSKHSIFQYELTKDSKIKFEKVIYTFKIEEGFPNGMAIDQDGNIYVALFKGGLIAKRSNEPTKIVCIHPETMKIIKEFIIPISHVTSCTIGGKDMNILYITTAYEPLQELRIKEEPYAGYLLQIPIDSIGVRNYEFQTIISEPIN